MEHNKDREKERSVDQKAGVSVSPASRNHSTDFAARQEQIERNAAMAKQGIGFCATVDPEAAKTAVTQLTNVFTSAMNDTKELRTRSGNEAFSLRETAAKYITTNPDAVQRKVDEVISRQNDTLAHLDNRIDSAAANAQMRLETSILRGDRMSNIKETIAGQSVYVRQVVAQSADRLGEVRLQMQTLGAEIKQAATRGIEYSWPKDGALLKRVEPGVVTLAVKPANATVTGTITLPDNTRIGVKFDTTRAGTVKNWVATCTGSDVKLVLPEDAVNHGTFFSATVVRDGGTTKVTEQQTSDTKKSVNGSLEVPLKVVTAGVSADASLGDSKGKAVEHTTNHQTSTSFGVKVVFEPRP